MEEIGLEAQKKLRSVDRAQTKLGFEFCMSS